MYKGHRLELSCGGCKGCISIVPVCEAFWCDILDVITQTGNTSRGKGRHMRLSLWLGWLSIRSTYNNIGAKEGM